MVDKSNHSLIEHLHKFRPVLWVHHKILIISSFNSYWDGEINLEELLSKTIMMTDETFLSYFEPFLKPGDLDV